MDASTVAVVASIIVAVVAIIPGTMALINQRKTEAEKAKLDKERIIEERETAAQTATMSLIIPLREEVSRLQSRVAELEAAVIDKTRRVGELMLEVIDKDTQLKTMEYKLNTLQMKLDLVVKPEDKVKVASVKYKPKKDTVPLAIRQEIEANTARKALITEETERMVQELKRTSISNGNKDTTKGE